MATARKETQEPTVRKTRVIKVKPEVQAEAPSGKKMSQRDMSNITKDLNEALNAIGKKHHIALGAYAAHLSKRGKLNIIVKGESGEESSIKKTKMLERRRDGETLPEYRMRVHHRQVGLDTDILHQNFKIGGKEYEVLGLRGKAHKVLLQNTKTSEHFEMLPSVFLEKTDAGATA